MVLGSLYDIEQVEESISSFVDNALRILVAFMDGLLLTQESSALLTKKSLRLWLTNLTSLLIYANYTNTKW